MQQDRCCTFRLTNKQNNATYAGFSALRLFTRWRQSTASGSAACVSRSRRISIICYSLIGHLLTMPITVWRVNRWHVCTMIQGGRRRPLTTSATRCTLSAKHRHGRSTTPLRLRTSLVFIVTMIAVVFVGLHFRDSALQRHTARGVSDEADFSASRKLFSRCEDRKFAKTVSIVVKIPALF